MKCPHCNINLIMTERTGIEIDYCPECRGIWLDRGELDKIIERSAVETRSNFQEKNQDKNYPYRESDYHYKKRKGIWGEIFDF